ncbi:MAG: hypothetical protein WCE68_09525 [Anaerolineales bacterium]
MVTDQDFKDLQRQVLQLEAKVAFLYNHLGVTFVPEAGPGDDPRVIEQIKKGNMMEAIKVYREINNETLPAAKQAVEEMIKRLGI